MRAPKLRAQQTTAMNYRHAYHAGNFADVLKHAVLTRILMHLRAKEAPFRVIDTHAGAGIYDLAGPEASRTGEWRDGIGRLMAAALPRQVRELLAPYLEAVGGSAGRLTTYPGSPALVRALLRAQDRLVACELETSAAAKLARHLAGDRRAKVVAIDGWTALSAYVPPKERRGAVLIDPPFEQPDEFTRLADRLAAACRKWATGIYIVWYPIKGRREPDAFARQLAGSGIAKILRAELTIAPARGATTMNGAGLMIVNPPWRLDDELAVVLPALAKTLARNRNGGCRLDWIAREK